MHRKVVILFLFALAGCGQTSYQGHEIDFWLAQFDHPDECVRIEASIALGKIGGPAVPKLRQKLKDKNRNVRLAAASALSKMYEDAQEAIPELVGLLKENDRAIRITAIRALGKMEEDGGAAVPALVPFLKSKDDDVRYHTAKALCRIGEDAGSAAKEIAVLLKDPNLKIRRVVAERIGNVKSEDTLPALVDALQDKDRKVRLYAGFSIKNLDRSVASEYGVW